MTDRSSRVFSSTGQVNNLRDLGGLRTTDGRALARSRLYRSEFLPLATDADRAVVEGLNLKLVVDLRRTGELHAELVNWNDLGVEHQHHPLRLRKGDSWTAGYHQYLEIDPGGVSAAVRALANPDNHPALFHCAAGKDRTGVIAALLLDLAGVVRDEIATDYAMTGNTLEIVLARLASLEPYRPSLYGTPIEEHRPYAATMHRFFDWLDDNWGGAEPWLLKHGMTSDEISNYRKAIVDPV